MLERPAAKAHPSTAPIPWNPLSTPHCVRFKATEPLLNRPIPPSRYHHGPLSPSWSYIYSRHSQVTTPWTSVRDRDRNVPASRKSPTYSLHPLTMDPSRFLFMHTQIPIVMHSHVRKTRLFISRTSAGRLLALLVLVTPAVWSLLAVALLESVKTKLR